ncbi:MAG TPA: lipid A biosynthesis lauroyl acyltransferase [Azospirillaceae bacterium]|nr:lipid A biosynthesis lauroyl acyltransferase [Azospirillaceae bacterium]
MAKHSALRRRFDRTLGYRIEAAAVFLLFGFLKLLPADTASDFGGWVGRTLGPRLGASRKAARNLERALPELDGAAHRRILMASWDNLGRTMAEYPHLGTIAAEWDKRVEMRGAEHIRALAEDGKPGLCITGHFANWELAALACHKQGLDIAIVYRAPNNPWVDRLLARARGSLQAMLLPKGKEAARGLVATMRRGGHVGILVDQKLNEGIPVPFLGRDAMTGTLMADLALRHDAPVVPIRVVRQPRGARFRIEALPPLDLPRGGDRSEAVTACMLAANRLLEGWVRETPGQWLWQHRRWPD